MRDRLFPFVLLVACSAAPVDPGPVPRDDGVASDARIASDAATLIWSAEFGQDFKGMAGGDLNGDGFADLVLGSQQSNLYTALGSVWVHYGSASGVPATPDLVIEGTATFDFYGQSVAAADVDGDGYDDLVVGAYGAGDDGEVLVHHGGPDGPATTPDATLSGSEGGYFGYRVADVGDVDGDGYTDIAVADAFYGRDGIVYLYRGSASGLESTPTSTVTRGVEILFGAGLAGLGDVDGDGFDDVGIGAPYAADGDGRLFIYLGSETGIGPTPDAHMDHPSGGASTYWGFELAGAGDVNGDGFDDIIAGDDRLTGGGASYLYLGSASGPGSDPDQTLTSATGDDFGSAVAGVGDLDGDGYDDVLIGDSGDNRVHVFVGSADGLDVDTSSSIESGSTTSELFGDGVLGLGDVNGDGLSDVLVRDGYLAYWDSTWQAMAHVFHGEVHDADGDGWGAEWDCNDEDAAILPWHCGTAGDVVIDGEVETMSGVLRARAVWIVNGGRLEIDPYDADGEGGSLRIRTQMVYVDADSAIDGTAAGYPGSSSPLPGRGGGGGGSAPLGFGGGGGHGGQGGDGMFACESTSGTGGEARGTEDDFVFRMGGGGGAGRVTPRSTGVGGRGGGALAINTTSMVLEGNIAVDGAGPPTDLGAERGGAGAGGSVFVAVNDLTCDGGAISAQGGSVSTGPLSGRAGAGGGGRLQFILDPAHLDGCTLTVDAGSSGCADSGVEDGTVYNRSDTSSG